MALVRLRMAVVFFTVLIFTFNYTAWGQAIERIGSDETLEIATWNIEWFGATGSGQGPSDVVQQRQNVHRIITESEIDLWGLQEIADEAQWQLLLNELGPPWTGRLATNSGQQRIGFIFNTDTIRFVSVKHILESFLYEFAGRPPLQIRVDAQLPDTTVAATFITLHMKCCGDLSSYNRRVEASQRLKTHIDFNYGVLQEPIAAVMGDFNDELAGSIRISQPSPYDNFLNNPGTYRFLTQPLDQANVPTYCGADPSCSFGSTLDHILITDAVFANYDDSSTDRLESVLSAIPGYTNTTSDHLPVYAVFSFPTNTAIEDPAALPGSIQITGLYPNPAGNAVNLEIESDGSRTLSLRVFDVLGRVVYRTLLDRPTAGSEQLLVPTMELATGTYLLRVESSAGSAQRTFLKAN